MKCAERRTRANSGCHAIQGAGFRYTTERVNRMGEKTQFRPGDRAPNNGLYLEVGESTHGPSVSEPQVIRLEQGDRFPETSNKDRIWTHKKN